MDYKVILEPDIESGGYVAYCPTLRGCVSEKRKENAKIYEVAI